MELQEKYFGSTVVIILGVILFILGLAASANIPNIAPNLKSGVIFGLPIIFGALAYKSTKKRRFITGNKLNLRMAFEAIYLVFSIVPIVYIGILLGNRASREIVSQSPIGFFLWLGILIAYFWIVFTKKQENENL